MVIADVVGEFGLDYERTAEIARTGHAAPFVDDGRHPRIQQHTPLPRCVTTCIPAALKRSAVALDPIPVTIIKEVITAASAFAFKEGHSKTPRCKAKRFGAIEQRTN